MDFRWRSLTIHDGARGKGGENGTRIIALTPYGVMLLTALPRRNEWGTSKNLTSAALSSRCAVLGQWAAQGCAIATH